MIIGAMKCATSTLHEQLSKHDHLFMSDPKEPNFFSNDEIYRKGWSWYSGLFSEAGDTDICGESSTHYTKLPTYPKTIERIRAHLGTNIQFIYIVRHPIERLISQYIHEWTQREISVTIDEAITRHPSLISYSLYSMQLKPFYQVFGASSVQLVFFERLVSEPQRVLETVCDFIGYKRTPNWDEGLEKQNASVQRLKRNAIRDAVIDLPGLKQLRRRFVPQSIRDRIKDIWTMKERPALSSRSIGYLEEVFDEDLCTLGRWLDVDLTCDTFKDVARRIMPEIKVKERETET